MNPTTPNQWQSVISRLLEMQLVNQFDVDNWLKQLQFVSFENGNLTLDAPSDFFQDWIMNHYKDAIEKAATSALEDFHGLTVRANKQLGQLLQEETTRCHQHQESKPTTPIAPAKPKNWLIDSFVVGAENRVAHAVAKSITENEGKREWPFIYIYGPSGIGKTHLLKGIAQKLSSWHCRQHMLSAESFVNAFLSALKEGRPDSFRKTYRGLQFLLVDDLDFLFRGNKVACRDEFQFTMDSIIQNGGTVIVCANHTPKELYPTHDKLSTCMGSGLTIQVKPPELALRKEIIARKARNRRLELNDELIETIAELARNNVREIMGIIQNLALLSQVYQRQVDQEMLREASGHIGAKLPAKPTIALIQQAVAKHFKIEVKMLNGRGRARCYVYPRQVAMFLCRELLSDKPLKEIGAAFGNKDHTTVLYSCEQIAKSNDLVLSQDLDAIRTIINS